MKNILVCGLAIILASCGSKYDAAKLSEKLTKELGVTVEVNVSDADTCGKNQLFSLYNEYKMLNSSARQLVKDKFSSFEKVVFAETQKVGTLKGKLVKLKYRSCTNGACYTASTKVIADNTVLDGSYPVAKADATNILTINSESMADLVDLTNYGTQTLAAYDLIEDMGEQFRTALELEAIYFLDRNDKPGLKCADYLKLIDIL